jgi:hypothetical protein
VRVFALALLSLASVSPQHGWAQAVAPVVPDTVAVRRATVIAFFPAVTQAQVDADEGLASGLSHVEFALDDVNACLRADSADVHLIFGPGVVLRFPGEHLETVRLGRDTTIAAVLLAPGRAGRFVFPTAGPSALIPMLGQAAAEYFSRPGCDPFGDR